MQLGSYQTAWTMLHRYRSVMVRPGRERLTGDVEVDEAFLGGPQPGVRGRWALGKTLIAGAVEREGDGFGRARLAVIDSADTGALRRFLTDHVAPGATVHTDGWSSYPPATRGLYHHEPISVSASGLQAHEVLPAVHAVFGMAKRWLMGNAPRCRAPGARAGLPRRVGLPVQPAQLAQPRVVVLPTVEPGRCRRAGAVRGPPQGRDDTTCPASARSGAWPSAPSRSRSDGLALAGVISMFAALRH